MEDGFPLFDLNDDAARQEQKLREYYEEFSANARQRLLAKTVVRPSSVYDVLYPRTRETLLSKNTPFKSNLEEDAKIIRDRLIAKLVDNETDLEKISADFRKSMLARAKIQDDRGDLMRSGEAFRKKLISKNSPKSSDIEKDSEQSRMANVAKNNPNLSINDTIDRNNDSFRESAVAKNSSKEQDLLHDSEAFRNQYRKNDIHKNVAINTDLEKDSESFRIKNLAKNTEGVNKQSVDEISKSKREQDAAKNISNESDLEQDSKSFRSGDLSKNPSKDQDLLRDSEDIRTGYREKDLNRNVPNNTDIEKDNELFRRDNLSKNVDKSSNLEVDSAMYRNSGISKNVPSKTGLDEVADEKRPDSLSKNKPSVTNLESNSDQFRKDDLSLNVPNNSDLEDDSKIFRSDDLSANKLNGSDLEFDSVPFRNDDLSFNKGKLSDLEEDSAQFRADDLSVNKPSESDLEIDSEDFRADDLSANKPSFSDLEKDSGVFREDDLSYNKPNGSNLETDSVPFRSDDLSFNTPNYTNLETDSVVFREDDLAANTPNLSDLEIDSLDFRLDDLAANTPNVTDLEADSVLFRTDDLSANSPNETDLEVDSIPFRNDDLAANVPSDSDLETDSVPFRIDDLASNVPNTSNLLTDSETFREDDLASNVPNTGNLAEDSIIHRQTDLAANVPINSSILADSVDFRDDAISSNVPLSQNLLTDSTTYRTDAIAKNAGYGLLGVNVNGAGTSAFLGISRVFTQGIILRHLLLSKNKSKNTNLLTDSEPIRENNKVGNRWQLSNDEYTATNENWKLGKIMQGSYNTNIVDYTALEPYYTPTAKAIFATDDFITTKGVEMQKMYGTSNRIDFPTGRADRDISDALYSVNPRTAKGGQFSDSFFHRKTYTPYSEGQVTSTIRAYNLERSVFNLHGLQAGDPTSLGKLEGFNQEGFQDLISHTIGSFKGLSQLRTLTTPAGIIQANGGTYYQGGAGEMDLLRPTANDAVLGSAESMMGKTALGNPYEDEDFFLGKRGVKHIVNTIKSSDQPLAANFDPQNNRAYITGVERDGSARVSRQRYTIANPYAPSDAGKLIFFIKNYASEEQFHFPPYITSMQNTENANWNSVNFLGRPEAVYTYNNSSRDASISFFVLTDYAQSVDIGRDWKSEGMEKVTATFDQHFTTKDNQQNKDRASRVEKLKAQQSAQAKEKAEIRDKIAENKAESIAISEQKSVIEKGVDEGSGSSWLNIDVLKIKNRAEAAGKIDENNAQSEANNVDGAELAARSAELSAEAGKTNDAIGEAGNDFNGITNYSETNSNAGNIYNIDMIKKEFVNGETVCKPEDTIKRINTMKKSLMFQPSYFSGDKIDFVRKVEFLSKLTRPSANESGTGTGFSFTKPPICHIHLGDWWNHDIVVNSVSFDYADAPWTLDAGRVQPMWVLVSINFNMIGPFRSFNAAPPLATDKGGMYSPLGGL
jgi:hypothetical protein